MCVRTHENPEVSVLCRFRRPGANARAKPVKFEKVAFSHFFDSLSNASSVFAIQAIDLNIRPMYNILRIIERYAHGKRKAF